MSFFEIFQPGLEHLRKEKDRYKMLVSKPTHGGGAPLGIDLEAGVAKIKIPARPAAAEVEVPDEPAGADSPTNPPAGHPATPTPEEPAPGA